MASLSPGRCRPMEKELAIKAEGEEETSSSCGTSEVGLSIPNRSACLAGPGRACGTGIALQPPLGLWLPGLPPRVSTGGRAIGQAT